MQRERNRLIAGRRMEHQQNRDAMLLAIQAMADTGVALHNEIPVCEGAEIMQTMKVTQDLRLQSFCERVQARRPPIAARARWS